MAGKSKTATLIFIAAPVLIAVTACEPDRDRAVAGGARNYPEYTLPLLPDPRIHNRVFSLSDTPRETAVRLAQENSYLEPISWPIAPE